MENSKIKFNWPLVGNQQIAGYLSKIITKSRTESSFFASGSYIFYGPNNLGKTTAANYFANSLVCQTADGNQPYGLPCGKCDTCRQINLGVYGDIYQVKLEDDKKEISIEQVRDFIHSLGMSSFFNSYKIGIIKDAEALSEKAANAMLKTLEEPRSRVIIILIAKNLSALPATIASRSQILEFKPVPSEVIYDYLLKERQAKRSEAKNFSHLCSGKPALAVKFLENQDFFKAYQERAKIFLDFHSQDLNARMSGIENILGAKASGQAAARVAAKILESWQAIVRDLLLLQANQENLVQHQFYLPQLQELIRKMPLAKLLSINQSLALSREYLQANVSPRAVLELAALGV